jgi:hypothetical protein
MNKVTFTQSKTRTNTSAISLFFDGKLYRVLLITSKGEIIGIFKEYDLFESCESIDLAGTMAKKYIAIFTDNMQKYGCTFNERSDFWNNIILAKRIQDISGFHYHNPIYSIAQKLENYDYKSAMTQVVELHEKNKRLDHELALFKLYGTSDAKKIERIKKEWAKEQARAKRAYAKVINASAKAKYVELTQKRREGYEYIAIVRNYANKGQRFMGETLEYRTEKPRTKHYFTISANKDERMETARRIVLNFK